MVAQLRAALCLDEHAAELISRYPARETATCGSILLNNGSGFNVVKPIAQRHR